MASAPTTFRPTVDPAAPAPVPRSIEAGRSRSDRTFFGAASLSGALVLAAMAAVGVFLSIRAVDALRQRGFAFLTTSEWDTNTGNFGIAAVIGFTIAIAAVAVVVAVPIALATSLFITNIAPTWLRSTMVAAIDLMAAVPSVVYGLWGAYVLHSHVISIARWMTTWLGWFPLFAVDNSDPTNPLASATVYSSSTFVAGLVVAMMVMPIQCSVMREVFSQVPAGEVEGAYALGSTRWGMIRTVALPFGRGGMIGGTMLGLGRALGETIAVVLIVSPRFDFTPHLLESGSNSVSSLIALRYPEASDFSLSALMAAGLTLFAMTLVVNFVAAGFVARSRSGASSEA